MVYFMYKSTYINPQNFKSICNCMDREEENGYEAESLFDQKFTNLH